MSCQCCGSHRDRDVTVSVSRGVVNCGGIMREFVQETFTFQARIGEPQGWRIASSSQSCPCAQPSSTRRIRRCADSCRCHNRAATPHMLCPRCGQATPVNASRCTACGEPFVHSRWSRGHPAGHNRLASGRRSRRDGAHRGDAGRRRNLPPRRQSRTPEAAPRGAVVRSPVPHHQDARRRRHGRRLPGIIARYERGARHHPKRGDTRASPQLDESPAGYALS